MESPYKRLSYKDGILLLEAFLLLTSIGVMTMVFSWETFFFIEQKEEKKENVFYVSLEGAIKDKEECVYQEKVPIRFKNILSRVNLKENADLSIYPKNKTIHNSLSFYIPEKNIEKNRKK
jgi:hypothetical protein